MEEQIIIKPCLTVTVRFEAFPDSVHESIGICAVHKGLRLLSAKPDDNFLSEVLKDGVNEPHVLLLHNLLAVVAEKSSCARISHLLETLRAA